MEYAPLHLTTRHTSRLIFACRIVVLGLLKLNMKARHDRNDSKVYFLLFFFCHGVTMAEAPHLTVTFEFAKMQRRPVDITPLG